MAQKKKTAYYQYKVRLSTLNHQVVHSEAGFFKIEILFMEEYALDFSYFLYHYNNTKLQL